MSIGQHPLDAYSEVVVRVAANVGPSVASVFVRTRRGMGAGSASVFTGDGFLLTSAHVVHGADGVQVSFADGTEADADVVGRDPLFLISSSDYTLLGEILAAAEGDVSIRRRIREGHIDIPYECAL